MNRTLFLRLATLAACLALSSVALAGNVEIRKKLNTTPRIDALALTSARWTGWMDAGDKRSVALQIDFTDANSSCTAVSLVCETSRVASTAPDSGADMHVLVCGDGGVCVSTPMTLCYGTDAACGITGGGNAAPGSKIWTWTIANIPDQWVNCKVSASGTPAAADVLTVYETGITP